jgi:putative Mg2+ transporter-C (MgtC) family protein
VHRCWRQWRQRGRGPTHQPPSSPWVRPSSNFWAFFSKGEHGADPTRIAAYIVSGVGFLGGGVILRQGMNVTGINTAAPIWCFAAVGTLSGAGYPIEATIGALLIVTVHLSLRPIARHIDRLPVADELETIYLLPFGVPGQE